jgi:hypothetical protein
MQPGARREVIAHTDRLEAVEAAEGGSGRKIVQHVASLEVHAQPTTRQRDRIIGARAA